MGRQIRKKGQVKVNTDPESKYSKPTGTPAEVQELLRRGWVKKQKTNSVNV